jgi:hypothetical protein
MRELLTFITIAFLVAVGWKQSFQSHWLHLTGQPTPAKARGATRNPAQPGAASKDNSWMWNRTKMDTSDGQTNP